MSKKKTVVEKVIEKVDHVIHPDHKAVKPSLDEAIGKAANQSERTSSYESDYAKHPKFAKFSKKGAE